VVLSQTPIGFLVLALANIVYVVVDVVLGIVAGESSGVLEELVWFVFLASALRCSYGLFHQSKRHGYFGARDCLVVSIINWFVTLASLAGDGSGLTQEMILFMIYFGLFDVMLFALQYFLVRQVLRDEFINA
jgi:hypothetical protein